MPAQWRGIVKICGDQLTQTRWTPILIQINEELLESNNLSMCVGVDYMLLDMVGDERHDIIAQHKRRTILAKRSLGCITLDERLVRPGGLTRT